MKVRNTFITFIISGFWHGANWTFIIWGALNAIYFLPLLLSKQNRNYIEIVAAEKSLPSIKEVFLILFTFSLTVLAWIFFRADNIGHAISYLSGVFSLSLFEIPEFAGRSNALTTIVFISIFVLIEWIGREDQFALQTLGNKWNRPLRYALYYSIILSIIMFTGQAQDFIYFKF